jgi:hypothetical protein
MRTFTSCVEFVYDPIDREDQKDINKARRPFGYLCA